MNPLAGKISSKETSDLLRIKIKLFLNTTYRHGINGKRFRIERNR